MTTYRAETRIHRSLLAAAEKRLLVWIAGRLPAWVGSDHLTALGAAAMAGAGLCYAAGAVWPAAPAVAVAMLALNWFGDSLDGTVARVRRVERPRYGFYVDHVLDAVGVVFVVGGLALGGFVSAPAAASFLIAYYLLTIEIALATHTVGTFRMSYWKLGPTELRILLAIGSLRLLASPWSTIAGHQILLFDLGMWIGTAGLVITFITSAVGHTRTLYLEETPRRAERKVSPVPGTA